MCLLRQLFLRDLLGISLLVRSGEWLPLHHLWVWVFFSSLNKLSLSWPMSFLAFAFLILPPIPSRRWEGASGCGDTKLLAWVNTPQPSKSFGFTFFPFSFVVVTLLSINNTLFWITVFRQSQFLKRIPTASQMLCDTWIPTVEVNRKKNHRAPSSGDECSWCKIQRQTIWKIQILL